MKLQRQRFPSESITQQFSHSAQGLVGLVALEEAVQSTRRSKTRSRGDRRLGIEKRVRRQAENPAKTYKNFLVKGSRTALAWEKSLVSFPSWLSCEILALQHQRLCGSIYMRFQQPLRKWLLREGGKTSCVALNHPGTVALNRPGQVALQWHASAVGAPRFILLL